MRIQVTVHTLEETASLAGQLAAALTPPDTLLLEGDLGAGKTTFTQALAKALGVTRTVNSPTFTIMKQYEGADYPLNHLDVYRLADSEEDLGWDEIFYGDAISIVEWAHYIEEDLPSSYLRITIRHAGESVRAFTFEPVGAHYEKLCKAVFE